MLRVVIKFVLSLVFILGLTANTAVAEKRVALVIGNSAYEYAPTLKNPKNDADDIATSLGNLGFEVVKGIDLTHVDFAQTVAKFRKRLRGADVGLLFYAGHGLQVHGRNYLAPVDAELADETSLGFEAVSLHLILQLMERETKTNLVFLDACRDNPLARNLARSMGTRSTAIGRGLAREETGLGTFIAFATQPGNVALDGEGNNSPFAIGVLNHIATPGLDVELVMRRVREDVINATGGTQVPWSNSSLIGSFVFKDKTQKEETAASGFSAGAKNSEQPAGNADRLAIELAFWQAAKDADSREAFEAYLGKYPKGNFASLATIQLSEIKQQQELEAKRKAELETAKKKKAEAELARHTAEIDRRRKELAALEKKQADEREQLAKERENLAKRLEELEDKAKQRAKRERESGPETAALAPDSDATDPPVMDERTMVLVLQNELRRVGCNPGKVDGIWGRKGSGALAKFNEHARLQLPTDTPTMEAVDAVKGAEERVCPLECGPQFNEVGGACVKKTCRAGQRLNSQGQCINVVVRKQTPQAPRPAPVQKKASPLTTSGDRQECNRKFGFAYCRAIHTQ